MMSQSHCCSEIGASGHNCRTCSSAGEDSSSTGGEVCGEIMLFGVRVKVDPMRKSVSMNNLSQYEQPATLESSNKNLEVAADSVAVDAGYASADDAGRRRSNGIRERKRGIPWSEEEHKLFVLGLQKVGKGDWKGISRNFVKSRTPTQVASHAQKYFLRRSNLNRRRRRSSLFDITTDSVAATPMEEEQVHGDNNGQSVSQTPVPSLQYISPVSGFRLAPFPVIVGPVQSPSQIKNHTETITFDNGDQVNDGSKLHVPPASNPSTMAGLNSNQKCEMDPLSLSLNLSLSYDQNQPPESRTYAFQIMSGLNNGDGIISVA